MEAQEKIALLIDAENVSKKYIKLIMDEISEYGIVTYKRVYGDFTNPSVSTWKSNLVDYAMTPVFQFNYTKGKNASDSAMVIDAMDILYSGKVNAFCLVTSDSDFTKLAIRLREAGMLVVGMGEQKTPSSLVAACDTFKYLDLLYSGEDEKKIEADIQESSLSIEECQNEINACINTDTSKFGEEVEKVNAIPDKSVVGMEITAIIKSISDENDWVFLGTLGKMLSKRIPGFDPRNYGFSKLKAFIESFDCYETQETPHSKNQLLKTIYIRMK